MSWPGQGHSWNRATILSMAPSSSGVYLIWNSNRWIYVGESNDIQRRLLEHFDDKASCIARQAPGAFGFELVNAGARVGRQNALIGQLRPACNQMLG